MIVFIAGGYELSLLFILGPCIKNQYSCVWYLSCAGQYVHSSKPYVRKVQNFCYYKAKLKIDRRKITLIYNYFHPEVVC